MSDKPLWQPTEEEISNTNLTFFSDFVFDRWDKKFSDYWDMHQWSVHSPDEFWLSVWEWCGVIGGGDLDPVYKKIDKMPGYIWFPDIKINFARNLLKRFDDSPAIIFRSENADRRVISFIELNQQVARLANELLSQGIKPGDRICALMPNIPETVIAMLASTAIGATWSSCSPDFGEQGVLDRFGQIAPKILFTVDGYFYNGKKHELIEKIKHISESLTTIQKIVVIPYLSCEPKIPNNLKAVSWFEFLSDDVNLNYVDGSFNHPLYIMYSSGTTGPPKCILHSAGGSLLKHLSEHVLHVNLKRNDKFFYSTTCGWMMWNWLVSGLASGATLILYEGSPFYPDSSALFKCAAEEKINIFGVSAKYIDSINKKNINPGKDYDLSSIRTILSTGSPLMPEGFDYVYKSISKNVQLSSISGGTDILGCFVGGNPNLPVGRGQIQCPMLGMQVEIRGEGGLVLNPNEKGELTCANPFPSMPISFLNDKGDFSYKNAYFGKFPGIWCHGDYAMTTDANGIIILGRSDSTLNPGGIRIGTAEIYRQADQITEVLESLVITQEWDNDSRLVLFVKLKPNVILDEALVEKICAQIKKNTTTRHVPEKIIQVPDIPRTKSGKITEAVVRRIIHGEEIDNLNALENPESLDFYADIDELKY